MEDGRNGVRGVAVVYRVVAVFNGVFAPVRILHHCMVERCVMATPHTNHIALHLVQVSYEGLTTIT